MNEAGNLETGSIPKLQLISHKDVYVIPIQSISSVIT